MHCRLQTEGDSRAHYGAVLKGSGELYCAFYAERSAAVQSCLAFSIISLTLTFVTCRLRVFGTWGVGSDLPEWVSVQSFTEESLEAHRRVFANPELGIGDATGMGPGKYPGGRRGHCALHDQLYFCSTSLLNSHQHP